jgi:predicted transcriptional regulator
MSPVFKRKRLKDGSFIEGMIQIIPSDRWRPHGVRYRLAWVIEGKCRVLMDNHFGKYDRRSDSMKAKKFKVCIEPTAEGFKTWFLTEWKAAEQRKPSPHGDYDLILSFPDISWIAKIFSPQRVRIIQAIKEMKPESIYQLAKILERAPSNVQKDVTELADLGILELTQHQKKGQKRTCMRPEYKWSGFDIAV